MISNPYPYPPTSTAWSSGFFKGFAAPEYSIEPPADIGQNDIDAFNAGVLAGQQVQLMDWLSVIRVFPPLKRVMKRFTSFQA